MRIERLYDEPNASVHYHGFDVVRGAVEHLFVLARPMRDKHGVVEFHRVVKYRIRMGEDGDSWSLRKADGTEVMQLDGLFHPVSGRDPEPRSMASFLAMFLTSNALMPFKRSPVRLVA